MQTNNIDVARARIERVYYFVRKIPYDGKGMLVAGVATENPAILDYSKFPTFIRDFDAEGWEFEDSTWNLFNKEFYLPDGHRLRVASLDGHGVHTVFYPLALPEKKNCEHEVAGGHSRIEYDFKPWSALTALAYFGRLLKEFNQALNQPLPYLVSMRCYDTEGLSFTSNPSGVRFQNVRTILHREELDFPTTELKSVKDEELVSLVKSMAGFIFGHFNFAPLQTEVEDEVRRVLGLSSVTAGKL